MATCYNDLCLVLLVFNLCLLQCTVLSTINNEGNVNVSWTSSLDENCSLSRLLQEINGGNCDTGDNKTGRIVYIDGMCCSFKAGSVVVLKMSEERFENASDVGCNCTNTLNLEVFTDKDNARVTQTVPCVSLITGIDFRQMHIYELSEDIFRAFEILAVLDLSQNDLLKLEHGYFNGLQNLGELYLQKNRIQYIRRGAFVCLENLQLLDLSFNRIVSVHRLAFEGLPKLRTLYLRGNRLSEPGLDFLNVLISLNVIDLSENDFPRIGPNCFMGSNITTIKLSQTRSLSFIAENVFVNCSQLTTLDLSDNYNLAYVDPRGVTSDIVTSLRVINITNTSIEALDNISETTEVIALDKIVDRKTCYPVVVLKSIYSNDSNWIRESENSSTLNGYCGPYIVLENSRNLSAHVGDVIHVYCYAVGNPWPRVSWQQVSSGTTNQLPYVTIATGNTLKLKLTSLDMAGDYRCVAESASITTFKTFSVRVNHTDVGLKVLASNARAIVVTWNKTLHVTHHLVLYRAYEKTSSYTTQHISEYWKIFRISSLTPDTHYEVCIASYSDVTDKTCVRAFTTRERNGSPGIHHNVLAIIVLSMSGVVFTGFVLSTVYKCFRKVQVIAKNNVFIVGAESRVQFDDTTETTFLYENQHTDLLLDNQDRTEL